MWPAIVAAFLLGLILSFISWDRNERKWNTMGNKEKTSV
jgi:hypothetical protein